MRCTFASLAFAALAAANPLPQAVSSSVAPESSSPAGCSSSYDGTFQIQVLKESSKRSIQRRQNTALVISLQNGVLTDSQGRTGYVASNSQFQFDSPPQAGAIYTAGFSICPNGYLAIGGDTTWYQCLSGTFYNLYDDNVLSTGQCEPVHIKAIGAGSAPAPTPSASGSGVATQIPDGQITASGVVSQIPDGQITGSAVTQISDGQIQAPSVTQISDGQVQAPSAPVTQISDGQIQAPSSAPVTQISDGQVQAPSAPVTQISDGQIQAPTGTGGYYGYNSSVAAPAPSVAPATGAGSMAGVGSQVLGLAGAVLAVALL